MPLVIYGLGGVHTHTFADESDFKKPGTHPHGLKLSMYTDASGVPYSPIY